MRRSPTASAAERRDAGFTLPELLISMVILSFIMGALLFALIVALRNTAATTERITAGSAQTLSAFFPADAMSTEPDAGASTDEFAASGCSDLDQGTNALLLQLVIVDGIPQSVSYRLVADPDSAPDTTYQLWRVSCVEGVGQRNIVVQGIVDPLSVTATIEHENPDGTGPIRLIRLTAAVGRATPVTLTVAGSPRSAGPHAPCSLVAASPQTVALRAGPPTRPVDPFVVAITTAGPCEIGQLAVSIPTGVTTVARTFTGADGAWSAAPVNPFDAAWSPVTNNAPRTVSATVTLDGALVGTFPLTLVAEPCSVASSTPTDVTYEADHHLTNDLQLRVVTVGPCVGPMKVALVAGSTNVAVDLMGPGPLWTATIAKGAHTWVESFGVGTVTSNSANAGTIGLAVSPSPCAFVGDPSRTLATDVTGQVTGVVTMNLTTTGVCGRLTLSVPTGGSGGPDPFVIDPLPGGPTAWTATIPRCTQGPCLGNQPPAPTWRDGPHTATIYNDAVPLKQFVLTAREVCSYISHSPNEVLLANDRLREDTEFTVTTRGNCGPQVQLSIQTGVGPGPYRIDLSGPGPGPGQLYRGTIAKTDTRWAGGARAMVIADSTGATINTVQLIETPTCAVVDNSWTTTLLVTNANQVQSGERIQFTTSGPCLAFGQLWLHFAPPGGPDTLIAADPAGPPNTWRTRDLGSPPPLVWIRNRTATIYVHTSNTILDGTTIAGIFDVRGQ